MHVKFYHRVCFQSTWRGGCEGGEHYYSPPGASPLPRGRHRTAGSRMGWTRPDPSSPGTERWLVTTPAPHPHPPMCLKDMPLGRSSGLVPSDAVYWILQETRAPHRIASSEVPQHLHHLALLHSPHCSPPESHLLGGRNVPVIVLVLSRPHAAPPGEMCEQPQHFPASQPCPRKAVPLC